MGKKRRVWWIVGSLVVAVALFAAVAFLVDYSSTDARIERAVAQIVEDYGFELQSQTSGYFGPQTSFIGHTYSRAPVGAETASEIAAILREACPSCKHDILVTTRDGDPWMEWFNILTEEQGGQWANRVSFQPDNQGFGLPEIEPYSSLELYNLVRPSLWQRIKGLWPW